MNPKEALEILKNASGLAPLTRGDHLKVMQAVNILEPLVREEENKNG